MRARWFLLLLILCSTLPLALVSAQDNPLGNRTPPAHPRLLLLKGEDDALKKAIAADPLRQKLHRAILAECDRLIPVPPVERIQIGRRLLDKSREALRRIFFLAYAYRLSGQPQYRDRAEKELLAIAAFSDWNPSHFLDVAEMTLAAAIGYDWLYGELSETSRATIRQAIQKKGLEPSFDPKYNSWLNASHNWNQVCNAGMTFGALAVYEDQPEASRTVINRAIQTVVKSMKDYGPDGAYPEGYSYWGYGTSFNVLLISALEKSLGSDFGLADQPGFLKTAAYMLHMAGPTGKGFNYSDAGNNSGPEPAMFWFAARQRDPSLLWGERQRLEQEEAGSLVRDRILPGALIWGSSLPLAKVTKPAATFWSGGGKNPVALMRSSWTDPNALYVGLKAGSPAVNHGHMDAGSFVMEAEGVRWAMDFGMQDYNSLESKGIILWAMGQDSPRWQIYRYNNYVHNTLTVNGQLQRVEGYAGITGVSDKPGFRAATTDLSTVYEGSLAKAIRGLAIVDEAYVVVQDELEASAGEASVRWTLLTPAEVRIVAPNRAELSRNGKKLIVQVEAPAGVTLTTRPTDPPHEYDAPNPGTPLLGFDISLPANTRQTLRVRLIPEKNLPKANRTIPALVQWPVSLK